QGAANEPAAAGFSLASAVAVPAELPPASDAPMTIPDEADAPAQPASGAHAGGDADPPNTEDRPPIQAASVYFNVASLSGIGTLQPWTPEASPLFDPVDDVDAAA